MKQRVEKIIEERYGKLLEELRNEADKGLEEVRRRLREAVEKTE